MKRLFAALAVALVLPVQAHAPPPAGGTPLGFRRP